MPIKNGFWSISAKKFFELVLLPMHRQISWPQQPINWFVFENEFFFFVFKYTYSLPIVLEVWKYYTYHHVFEKFISFQVWVQQSQFFSQNCVYCTNALFSFIQFFNFLCIFLRNFIVFCFLWILKIAVNWLLGWANLINTQNHQRDSRLLVFE